MRLFVAVDVSDDTRRHLDLVRLSLQSSLAQARHAPRVSWVASAAAHVTLRFIGEVSAEVAARVSDALAPPLPVDPYHLEFAGVGSFPNPTRPRVIWIGAARGGEETAALAQLVNARLDPIIGAGANRLFRAHLTVGRVKEPGRVDWMSALARVNAGGTTSRIDHVTLYQSKTGAGGPTYTPLCRARLTAA